MTGRLGIVALLAVIFTGSAFAAGGPKQSPDTTTEVQVSTVSSESTWMLPARPSWCLAEDDYHSRTWQGALNGTFVATEYFCTPGIDIFDGYAFWDGGAVGLTADLYAVGTLSHLTLSNAGGTYNPAVSQDAVLVGTETLGHGKNTYVRNHYVACAYWSAPNFSRMGPWTGTWTATVAGSFSAITFSLTAQMDYFVWRQGATCPAGTQP